MTRKSNRPRHQTAGAGDRGWPAGKTDGSRTIGNSRSTAKRRVLWGKKKTGKGNPKGGPEKKEVVSQKSRKWGNHETVKHGHPGLPRSTRKRRKEKETMGLGGEERAPAKRINNGRVSTKGKRQAIQIPGEGFYKKNIAM